MDLESWWRSLPIVTKYLFVGTMGTTLASSFGFVSPLMLTLNFSAIFRQFQLWRLVSNFLLHSLGFPFLISMMFLVRYGSSLEQSTFEGRLSDFIFFLLISCSLLILIGGYFLGSIVLAQGLIMVLVYYWSRKNPDATMSLMFGIQFKSVYLPWVLVGMSILMGKYPIIDVVGIVVGHFYFFFTDVYPRTSGGRQLLTTPKFLVDIVPREYNRMIYGVRRDVQEQRRDWGRGQAVGGR
eukprot:TRINITY_DN5871_c0_g1_i1.p1 TRINITY_DN5871_c0_g1~~TRINITY_DN5871_c0_g1_i1.p1  ORF type:complete len:238 (-),score=23.77 TRINITY_DN5871_c0_g1_i1:124-837(-)